LERLKENLQQVSLPAGIEGSLLLLRNYEWVPLVGDLQVLCPQDLRSHWPNLMAQTTRYRLRKGHVAWKGGRGPTTSHSQSLCLHKESEEKIKGPVPQSWENMQSKTEPAKNIPIQSSVGNTTVMSAHLLSTQLLPTKQVSHSAVKVYH
jgi:hypothetical protein